MKHLMNKIEMRTPLRALPVLDWWMDDARQGRGEAEEGRKQFAFGENVMSKV